MKVVLCMVMSLDGKTTKGRSSTNYSWTSKEDRTYFSQLIKEQKVIIMGSNTFLAARSIIKLHRRILRIVLTKTPDKFKQYVVPGQLEFTNSSPVELIKKLVRQKYKQVLLAGGANLNTSFLKERLVDELWITVEPKVFGAGKSLTSEKNFNVQLQLISSKKLNNQGTLLLKYKVLSIA